MSLPAHCDLLHALHVAGVRLRADGDWLALDAPEGIIVPPVLDLIRLHKAAILAELRWIEDATAELDAREQEFPLKGDMPPVANDDRDDPRATNPYLSTSTGPH